MTRVGAAVSACILAVAVAGAGAVGAQGDDCGPCGLVTSIRMTKQKEVWVPLGAMTPGTIPGSSDDLGSASRVTSSFQIGKGLTNEGLVVLGSAGGAGYAKRPNSYERPRWDVTVKMDGGAQRVVSLAYEPLVREGDRVRVLGNQVELVQ